MPTDKTLRIIDRRELRRRVPYSPQHIARLEKVGEFPRRLRLGANRVGWVEDEVDAWIEQKVLERTSGDSQVEALLSTERKKPASWERGRR